jgi:voltage-gated sodium channel
MAAAADPYYAGLAQRRTLCLPSEQSLFSPRHWGCRWLLRQHTPSRLTSPGTPRRPTTIGLNLSCRPCSGQSKLGWRATSTLPRPASSPPSPSVTLRALIESPRTERFITALIVVNAITLGLETSPTAMEHVGPLLLAFDTFVIAVFTIEIALPWIAVHRLEFFRQPWSIFDFIVVAIAIVPATEGLPGPAGAQGLARVARDHRRAVAAPGGRRPGERRARHGRDLPAARARLLCLLGHGDQAVRGQFPDWFGTIGASAYSLFQIMTLESWSMGIVRPVMEVYPTPGPSSCRSSCAPPSSRSTCSSASSSAPCRANTSSSSSWSRWNSTKSAGAWPARPKAAREATHDDTMALGQEIRALRQELNELLAGAGRPATPDSCGHGHDPSRTTHDAPDVKEQS